MKADSKKSQRIAFSLGPFPLIFGVFCFSDWESCEFCSFLSVPLPLLDGFSTKKTGCLDDNEIHSVGFDIESWVRWSPVGDKGFLICS